MDIPEDEDGRPDYPAYRDRQRRIRSAVRDTYRETKGQDPAEVRRVLHNKLASDSLVLQDEEFERSVQAISVARRPLGRFRALGQAFKTAVELPATVIGAIRDMESIPSWMNPPPGDYGDGPSLPGPIEVDLIARATDLCRRIHAEAPVADDETRIFDVWLTTDAPPLSQVMVRVGKDLPDAGLLGSLPTSIAKSISSDVRIMQQRKIHLWAEANLSVAGDGDTYRLQVYVNRLSRK